MSESFAHSRVPRLGSSLPTPIRVLVYLRAFSIRLESKTDIHSLWEILQFSTPHPAWCEIYTHGALIAPSICLPPFFFFFFLKPPTFHCVDRHLKEMKGGNKWEMHLIGALRKREAITCPKAEMPDVHFYSKWYWSTREAYHAPSCQFDFSTNGHSFY